MAEAVFNPAIATTDDAAAAKAAAEKTVKPKPVPFYKKKSVQIGAAVVVGLAISIPTILYFVKKAKKK